MAGWIKLWRQTLSHGHFHMPEYSFKLWLYCLLKASPFPEGELLAGELYLSYKEIQANIGRPGRVISKSTISASLRYLQENQYLAITAVPQRKLKVRLLNWHKYQAGEECNGPRSGTVGVPMASPHGTDNVPTKALPGTAAVPIQYTRCTATSTPSVPTKGPQAKEIKASAAPKNKLKNTQEDRGNTPQTPQLPKRDQATLADTLAQFPRYTNRQTDTIRAYWQALSQTRKTRTISPTIIVKHMQHWERYATDIVLEALTIHLSRYQDKREEYTIGIMRRLESERSAGGTTLKGGKNVGNTGENTTPFTQSRPPSRYAHLAQ